MGLTHSAFTFSATGKAFSKLHNLAIILFFAHTGYLPILEAIILSFEKSRSLIALLV